jgi:hypothetical protein
MLKTFLKKQWTMVLVIILASLSLASGGLPVWLAGGFLLLALGSIGYDYLQTGFK